MVLVCSRINSKAKETLINFPACPHIKCKKRRDRATYPFIVKNKLKEIKFDPFAGTAVIASNKELCNIVEDEVISLINGTTEQ